MLDLIPIIVGRMSLEFGSTYTIYRALSLKLMKRKVDMVKFVILHVNW